MAASIYVTGSNASGKTLIIYGLMNILSEMGIKVGYYKPISIAQDKLGPGKWVDDDVISLREIFTPDIDLDILSPLVIKDRFIEYREDIDNILDRLNNSYKELSRDRDVLFIEGYGTIKSLSSINLSGLELCKLFEASPLFIIRNGYDRDIDELIVWYKDAVEFGIKPLGTIINSVPLHLWERVETYITDFLKSVGIKVYGILPDRDEFIAPTLLDVAAGLDAEVLCCDDKLHRYVGDILVGAMRPSSALRWLRSSRNPLIITGGDRTELLLTAIESGVSGIILTGNLYPAIKVIERAKEKEVPLLLVQPDTYTAVEKLRKMHGRVTPDSLRAKTKIVIDLIKKHIDIDSLVNDIIG